LLLGSSLQPRKRTADTIRTAAQIRDFAMNHLLRPLYRVSIPATRPHPPSDALVISHPDEANTRSVPEDNIAFRRAGARDYQSVNRRRPGGAGMLQPGESAVRLRREKGIFDKRKEGKYTYYRRAREDKSNVAA
jgi:hypothetical protein